MSTAKRQVIQRLHDMGFSDTDIRAALNECGYNTEACADWIVNRKQEKKPRLFVGMEVWIYSPDDRDWCPGNVVSITKQLLSIIFNGHDFRWLEKDSDIYRIQDEKPAPMHTHDRGSHRQIDGHDTHITHEHGNNKHTHDPYSGNMQHEKSPPRGDEVDYHVTFTESVLGLELYSDEDGFNCIVGRCVSTIARQKVTPGSQIVQVNDRWLANYRFEEIRDAVKQAARQPPLAVTFRIKKNLMRGTVRTDNVRTGNRQHLNTQAINIPNGQPSPYNQNGFDVSQSATSPDTQNHPHGAPKNDEQKHVQAHHEVHDFMGPLPFSECEKLQIGDHIDHRDDVGRFLLATIVDKENCRVKIHYEGWNSKWDTWCDFQAETHRFAAPRSVSRKPNTRFRDLKIRDYVDINPVQRHKGWRVGQIRRMDKYSGQSQIVYKEEGQEFLYWAHLNNPLEIAPFMTRAAETIALQQKIAEFEEEQAKGIGDGLQNQQIQHDGHVPTGPIHDNVVHISNQPPQNIQNMQNMQNYNGHNAHNGQPQPPSANGMMKPVANGMGHQKQRSRVLPRSLKNKKLPPKPKKKQLPNNNIGNVNNGYGQNEYNQQQNGYVQQQQQPMNYGNGQVGQQMNYNYPNQPLNVPNGYPAVNGHGNGQNMVKSHTPFNSQW